MKRGLKHSFIRHFIQNALMGFAPVRALARRLYDTGLKRRKAKILDFLTEAMEIFENSGISFENKHILELGPGQTPDLLFACLLYGAAKVYGADTVRYLHKEIYNTGHYAGITQALKEGVENGILPKTRGLNFSRFGGLNVIPEENFTYCIIEKHGRLPVGKHSIDLAWSRSVLEHVKKPYELIDELNRLIRPDGYMYHVIDLRDHTTLASDMDWLKFLKYDAKTWEMMTSNRSTWTNRLRCCQWELLFKEFGFKVLWSKKITYGFHKDFSIEELSKPFCNMAADDLNVAWYTCLCQKRT